MSDDITETSQTVAAELDRIIDLLGYARGNTARDMNRAIDQAAKVLGVSFKEMHRLLKWATISGSQAAVKKFGRPLIARQPDGYVYFAEDRIGGRIKIGFSAQPATRIDVVSRLTGIDLVDQGCFPGHMLNEHIAHIMARPALIGGEWYDATALRSIRHFRFLSYSTVPNSQRSDSPAFEPSAPGSQFKAAGHSVPA